MYILLPLVVLSASPDQHTQFVISCELERARRIEIIDHELRLLSRGRGPGVRDREARATLETARNELQDRTRLVVPELDYSGLRMWAVGEVRGLVVQRVTGPYEFQGIISREINTGGLPLTVTALVIVRGIPTGGMPEGGKLQAVYTLEVCSMAAAQQTAESPNETVYVLRPYKMASVRHNVAKPTIPAR